MVSQEDTPCRSPFVWLLTYMLIQVLSSTPAGAIATFTPNQVVLKECQTTLIAWTGGRLPYTFSVVVRSNGDTIDEIHPVTAGDVTSFEFASAYPSGSVVTFAVKDDTGTTNTMVSTIQAGSSDDCLQTTSETQDKSTSISGHTRSPPPIAKLPPNATTSDDRRSETSASSFSSSSTTTDSETLLTTSQTSPEPISSTPTISTSASSSSSSSSIAPVVSKVVSQETYTVLYVPSASPPPLPIAKESISSRGISTGAIAGIVAVCTVVATASPLLYVLRRRQIQYSRAAQRQPIRIWLPPNPVMRRHRRRRQSTLSEKVILDSGDYLETVDSPVYDEESVGGELGDGESSVETLVNSAMVEPSTSDIGMTSSHLHVPHNLPRSPPAARCKAEEAGVPGLVPGRMPFLSEVDSELPAVQTDPELTVYSVTSPIFAISPTSWLSLSYSYDRSESRARRVERDAGMSLGWGSSANGRPAGFALNSGDDRRTDSTGSTLPPPYSESQR